MTRHNSHISGLLVLAATAWLGTAIPANAQSTADVAAQNNFGAEVTNIATLTYTVGDATSTVETAPAVFIIRPPEAPAEIEFFRYAPTASNPITRAVNGSNYSPSGNLAGPFVETGAPVTTGGTVVDLSSPVPLIPATTFLAGELMFVRVIDTGQNLDSNKIENLVIVIAGSNGDVITLQLYETGPDTGEFFAYLPSTADQTAENDNVISAAGNTQLRATYIDAFDSTDVVIDTAVLNPLNRVFSSVDGAPIDGAVVTLINLDTGVEAEVWGVDGFSTFPAEVMSGEDQRDSSGLLYENAEGEFRYPIVEAGTYVIRVDPPEGFNFATVVGEETLNDLSAKEGFVITQGSFGRPFTIDQTSPLRFDIPLDPESDLVVEKVADRQTGDVGDYVNYTVTIRNQGVATAPLRLFDTLPMGFRYVPGTTRLERQAEADPEISDDAVLLTFDMGLITPGESVTLDYVLQIGPGAHMGDAVNEAVVRDASGEQISNIARAEIALREDLLRSTSTIIGRVTEQSCNGDEKWVRPIERGFGVPGVRLYMETGAYVVSDSDGLFHFEGVTEGTHVVQVDEETLPQGFELMKCEENTRYAGAANSKFIDVQGGGIWRANFYLKQTGEVEVVEEEDLFSDAKEYLKFDVNWLDTQDASPEWVYPSPDRTPSTTSTHVGIKHGFGQTVSIRLNDRDVEAYYFNGRTVTDDRAKAISRWRGLPLQDGRNVFVATVRNEDGSVAETLREEIWFVKTIARAIPMIERSTLVADGRIPPVVAIRLEDPSGRPVHAGRVTTINLEPPYRLFDADGTDRLRQETEELLAPLSARRDLSVGADGILNVELEPTLRTGKVTVLATMDDGREIPIYMYLEPEKRDWILVGLAEGSAALQNIEGNAVAFEGDADDVITDGRVAFFAKGLIKGDWLMTLALDTDKRRGSRDDAFAEEIDPNAFYTLYGDRTYQEFEGASRYPLYVKIEKSTAYALFGDYETNITEGRLTSYNRRLTGLKGEYLGENIQVLGFAAETNQGFAQDEIPGDGLSGNYQLSNTRILPQSEEIVIETRDRVRPDIVLERKVLVRFLDYTLDYFTGQLIFRLPVDATDANFNPNVIVASYETSEDAERNITAGGRVQAQFLDNKIQVGSTFTHEDGSSLVAGAKSQQIGVDLIAEVTENTQIRAEYAVTDQSGDEQGVADAKLLEIIHTSEKITAEAYYREEDGGFGLGQRTSNTNGVRRYGARTNLLVNETDDADTGRRASSRLEAQVYREENLGTGDARNNGEILAHHQGTRTNVSGGLRFTEDELVDREDRNSLLAVSRASYDIPKHGLTLQASAAVPIDGQDEVSSQPSSIAFGVDKRVGKAAVVNLRHEILNGGGQQSGNTTLGVSATPWNGGTATVAADNVTNDSGERLGATVGLDQTVRLTDKISGSLGIRARRMLREEQDFIEVAPDDAISPFETNEDFQSMYLGAAYSTGKTAASARVEVRDSSLDQTWITTSSVARELSEKLSLAGTARARFSNPVGAEGTDSRLDVRLGAAWRPRDEGTVVFNRLDITHTDDQIGQRSTKLVNNVAMNTLMSDRWQLSTNWGTKYVKAEIGDQNLSNWTNLVGAETRYDVTEKIDLGLRGTVMTGEDTGTSYSWGPSVGVSPVDNVWISAGYNVVGFRDDDFEAAEYTRKGVYLQMRVKFDQNTASGLLRRISPSANVVGPAAEPQTLSQAKAFNMPTPAAAPAQIVVAEAAPAQLSDYETITLKSSAPEEVREAVAMAVPANAVVPETAIERQNLNVCGSSPVKLFDVPVNAIPQQMERLGTMPQFGESHDLSPTEFYEKLDARYNKNAQDKSYLDYLFKSMGYANGWADAQPSMFSDDVLPVGTSGLMGMSEEHHQAYVILPSDEHDREAFRVQSANGSVVHFLKSCGNYMYGCE